MRSWAIFCSKKEEKRSFISPEFQIRQFKRGRISSHVWNIFDDQFFHSFISWLNTHLIWFPEMHDQTSFLICFKVKRGGGGGGCSLLDNISKYLLTKKSDAWSSCRVICWEPGAAQLIFFSSHAWCLLLLWFDFIWRSSPLYYLRGSKEEWKIQWCYRQYCWCIILCVQEDIIMIIEASFLGWAKGSSLILFISSLLSVHQEYTLSSFSKDDEWVFQYFSSCLLCLLSCYSMLLTSDDDQFTFFAPFVPDIIDCIVPFYFPKDYDGDDG